MKKNHLKISWCEKTKSEGQILAEIILIIAIIMSIVAVSGELIYTSFNSQNLSQKKLAAAQLLEESLETLRAVLDFDDFSGTYGQATQGWNRIYLPPDGTGDKITSKGIVNPYHIENILNRFVVVSGEEQITLNGNVFFRKITIENVSRDPTTKTIESVYNQSNDDPSTQKITVTVSGPDISDLTVSKYITRSRNDVCAQTNWSGGALATTTRASLANCQSFIYFDSQQDTDTSFPGTIKLMKQ